MTSFCPDGIRLSFSLWKLFIQAFTLTRRTNEKRKGQKSLFGNGVKRHELLQFLILLLLLAASYDAFSHFGNIMSMWGFNVNDFAKKAQELQEQAAAAASTMSVRCCCCCCDRPDERTAYLMPLSRILPVSIFRPFVHSSFFWSFIISGTKSS